jgi:uncharacterized protein involved in tolerance to divalent cations
MEYANEMLFLIKTQKKIQWIYQKIITIKKYEIPRMYRNKQTNKIINKSTNFN